MFLLPAETSPYHQVIQEDTGTIALVARLAVLVRHMASFLLDTATSCRPVADTPFVLLCHPEVGPSFVLPAEWPHTALNVVLHTALLACGDHILAYP